MLRISRVLVYIMVLLPCMTRSFLATNGLRRIQHRASRSAPIRSVEPKQELIIGTSRTADSERVEALISCRKGLHKCNTDDRRIAPGKIMWAAFRNGIQLDGIELEDQYLGSVKSSASDTVKAWQKTINSRQDSHGVLPSGEYKMELDVSIRAVQRAAFVIRSLQRILLDPAAEHLIKGVLRSTSYAVSANKTDKTPVTVADFAVQALVIDALSTAFPGDLFIAEEDSALVRADPAICEAVLMIMRAATGVVWTSEKLYAVLDRGSYGTEPASATTAPASSSATVKQRTWVLDPIDGTKGFMRGEHCCTGLGLLVDGVAQLSVLGCPNLNLLRLLQGSSYDDKDITYIDPPVSLHGNQPQYPTVFHPHSGSLYFAVTNQGAFARSLSMPLGAAFEVTTSAVADSSQAKLCESAEAMFGDREVAARTAEHLGVKNDYLRIDGMCKHCVVGVGAAEATLRLPPGVYREKIWDHVAGDHFVREAGGTVTDLRGERLDYSAVKRAFQGTAGGAGGAGLNDVDGCRELGAEVQGVVISNGLLHVQIVKTINEVRSNLHRE